jgi:hypothetical protein
MRRDNATSPCSHPLVAGLAVVCLLSNAGCHSVSSQTITVVHRVTGEPLQGVEVSPYYDAVYTRPRFDKGVTDANGRATLDLAWGRNYQLIFALPNGQRRRVWLGTQSGWAFRLWPEPYRRVTIVVPDRFRGLLYVQGVSDDDLYYGLHDGAVLKNAPRFELSTGLVAGQVSGFAVLKENGIAQAAQLESVRYAAGERLPVEKWFGPELAGVAVRPIGYWNRGPDDGSYAFWVGTADEARKVAKRVYRDALPQQFLSSTKSFTVQHRYLDDDLAEGN